MQLWFLSCRENYFVNCWENGVNTIEGIRYDAETGNSWKSFFFFAFVWLNKLSTPYYSFIIILHGRQPKVILTNVLGTKIGRKYTQAQPKTDANFSDAGKLQSNQPPSSSVASLKIWQILNPALHSPFLSKRYVVFALCH